MIRNENTQKFIQKFSFYRFIYHWKDWRATFNGTAEWKSKNQQIKILINNRICALYTVIFILPLSIYESHSLVLPFLVYWKTNKRNVPSNRMNFPLFIRTKICPTVIEKSGNSISWWIEMRIISYPIKNFF